MIRGGTPRKYKPTKSSKLPKPRKLDPRKLPTIQYTNGTATVRGIYCVVYSYVYSDRFNNAMYIATICSFVHF